VRSLGKRKDGHGGGYARTGEGNGGVRYSRVLGDALVEGVFEQVLAYYSAHVSGRIGCGVL
jgi:hypothetical protein